MYSKCLYNLEAFTHKKITIVPQNSFFGNVKPVLNGTYFGVCILYYGLHASISIRIGIEIHRIYNLCRETVW
jgi:hypothetical protein